MSTELQSLSYSIYTCEVDQLNLKKLLRDVELTKSSMDFTFESDMVKDKTLTNETLRKLYLKTKQSESTQYQDLLTQIQKYEDEISFNQCKYKKLLRDFKIAQL